MLTSMRTHISDLLVASFILLIITQLVKQSLQLENNRNQISDNKISNITTRYKISEVKLRKNQLLEREAIKSPSFPQNQHNPLIVSQNKRSLTYLKNGPIINKNNNSLNGYSNNRIKRHYSTNHLADCDGEPFNRAAIFGLRCDYGGEVKDGILVIKANEPTVVILIGRHLDTNLSVALTPSQGSSQDDCTHTDRVKSLQIHNISSNIAQIVIDLPSPGLKVPLYLCIREAKDGAGWYHQGSEAWLKIFIKQDFLPLYMKIIVIACLLMLSGLFSGLNLGLMALDKNELQVIISCGSETEKRYARAIEPVRRRGNYLLCSILFSNVLVNSTIAVLLEELTSGIVAVMTSTIFIVMFGEILPQAFCSRHGLAVGAKTVSITYLCMAVTAPLSYPVSYFLDLALGEEIGHAYNRERLMEFIRVTKDYNNLEADEVNIISGALKLKDTQISEIMTSIDDVYSLDVNSVLDFDTIQSIIERGYSRIPVHENDDKRNIIALLFAKDLALLDPDDKTPVQTMINFYNHPIMDLYDDTTLDKALNEFKTGKSHMAFVKRLIVEDEKDNFYETIGVVTLEDVIEEIMQMEINDETDTLTDNRRKRRRKEAQVRKDFSQFTNLGSGDTSHNIITPQLALAAYQYLATRVEPFSTTFISYTILKRLLSQKIYYKVRTDEHVTNRRLYTAGEAADHFIMILEGRVHVVCGKEGLVFDAGPFSYFGKASLNASHLLDNNNKPLTTELSPRKESSGRQPNMDRRESNAARSLNNQFSSISMKKLEQVVAEADNPANSSGLSANNNNYSDSNSNNNNMTIAIPSAKLKSSDSYTSIYSTTEKQAAQFIPDYTVEVVVNTSYVKVTRSEYLTAVKATLVERGKATENLSTSDQNLTLSLVGPQNQNEKHNQNQNQQQQQQQSSSSSSLQPLQQAHQGNCSD